MQCWNTAGLSAFVFHNGLGETHMNNKDVAKRIVSYFCPNIELIGKEKVFRNICVKV